MTLTLSQATPAELAAASAELDGIRASPAFLLCTVWLRHRDLSPAPVDYPHRWLPIWWIANCMRLTFGGHANDFSMGLALEHRGVELRIGKNGDLEANVDEHLCLEALRDHGYPRRGRHWPQFSNFDPVSAERH